MAIARTGASRCSNTALPLPPVFVASVLEIARLSGLNATANEQNLQHRERIARAEEREIAQEQKYNQMKADLDATFKSAAADALSANNASFLLLANQKLGAQSNEAKQTLEAKELAIKNLVDPIGVALGKLDEQARAMELVRSGAYSEVKVLVESMQW